MSSNNTLQRSEIISISIITRFYRPIKIIKIDQILIWKVIPGALRKNRVIIILPIRDSELIADNMGIDDRERVASCRVKVWWLQSQLSKRYDQKVHNPDLN